MDLTNKSEVKELLKKHNAKPEKYLGQHFILSEKALNIMIGVAEIKKTDIIVEIGPGLGTLTLGLAKTGATVIAIERDPLMIEILKETISDYKNIKIIEADAKTLLMSDTNNIGVGHQYKVVANLPYNAATFLTHKWLELENPPDLMVLMIQKEVAQRMVAKSPRSNLLATSVQFYADAKITGYVPAEAFWPKPKVDSAIVKLVPKKIPRPFSKGGRQKTRDTFFTLVKAGFSQPRKQLAGNLSKKLGVQKEKIVSIFKYLKISETARAENLSLEQWTLLAKNLYITYFLFSHITYPQLGL